MDRLSKPGMAEPISTRSAARKRALKRRKRRNFLLFFLAVLLSVFLGILLVKPVVAPEGSAASVFVQFPTAEVTQTTQVVIEETPEPDAPTAENTKQPKLPTQAQAISYPKGTPLLYYAQSGDSLDVLAVHFGVEISEITSTTPLPEEGFISSGQLLLIPSRLEEISSPLKLMPDTEIVNSPSTIDFDVEHFVEEAGGYLSTYSEYLASTGTTSGAQIITRVALEYSINPRMLLGLLENQSGWVYGNPEGSSAQNYPMGYVDSEHKGLYKQAVWAAGEIATGYYGWREGTLVALTFPDKSMLRLAPDLNSGTAGLMYFFSRLYNIEEWAGALYTDSGLIDLYTSMFGNPWLRAQEFEPLFTPEIKQPEMILPFEIGRIWALTGGPHAAWGAAEVRGALDFAPPSDVSGCVTSSEWVVASISGLVVRSGDGAVVIDMDEDGYEQTGWNIVYMHVATQDRIPLGTIVEVGDRIGHPSCEGGRSTGTHVHITRKYNGEWVPADGPLPFVLSGWKAKAGSSIYTGWLMRDGQIVRASLTSSTPSHIQREE
jgi:LasA protease